MDNKTFLSIINGDKKLLAMLSGIVLDSIILVSIAITASIWYLV